MENKEKKDSITSIEQAKKVIGSLEATTNRITLEKIAIAVTYMTLDKNFKMEDILSDKIFDDYQDRIKEIVADLKVKLKNKENKDNG